MVSKNISDRIHIIQEDLKTGAKMQVVKLKGKVRKDGHLKLDIPNLESGEKEIVIIIENNTNNKYDLSGLSGSLQWHRDAVKEQRKLRDEW